MRFSIIQKKLIVLFIVLLSPTTLVFGQLRNFGTNTKFKPQPNYFYSVYAYYDVVREYGFGIQYQLNNKFSLDLSFHKIYSYGFLYEKIYQWDYYDFQGYGLSLKPKFMFSPRNRLYVGINVSFEQLSHGLVPVEFYNGRGTQFYHEVTESKGTGSTIGITFGNKISYKHIFFEPFLSLGVTNTKTKNTVVSSSYDYYSYMSVPQYPITSTHHGLFFQTNIGLKLGFSFKKSKKHEAIDKKFDKLYIPKSNNLKTYFKSVNFKDRSIKKDMRRAYARYEALNRNALQKYRRYYSDTTKLYKAVDFLFNRIDSLIVKGNK